MKIGDRCFVHGYIDEIRKDTVIVRNHGGYFGTDPGEVITVNDTAHPNWISCRDRLPDCNGIYIVTRIISDGFECRNIVDTCYFDGSNTWHDDTRVNHERKCLADVLAWCELPEPYREEGDK